MAGRQHRRDFPRGVARQSHPHDVRGDADQLRPELAGVAVEESPHATSDTVRSVAISAVGKQTDRQNSPEAADAVHRARTDWVIDVKVALDEDDGDADQNPRNTSDENSRGRGDESTRRSDRD